MYDFDTENKHSSGIALLNLILIIAFIGLIAAGCSFSVKNTTQSDFELTEQSIFSLLPTSFHAQQPTELVPSKRKSAHLARTQMQKPVHLASAIKTSESDKKIALLSMIFVMLKQG